MSVILPFRGKTPVVSSSAFIAPTSALIGDVEIGDNASIWFQTTIRGDINFIRIGAETNIQDNTVVHVDHKKYPTIIGKRVTIGHGAIIHACEIQDECLIGMGAIVLDGAVLPTHSFVAANSLVPPGKTYPPNHMLMGSPAKAVRPLKDEEIEWIKYSAKHYCKIAAEYQ